MLNVVLRPAGLTINGALFTEAPPLEKLLPALGRPTCREIELPDQGKPWRKFVILDDLGIHLLYDFGIERVLGMEFGLEPSNARAAPRTTFAGLIFANGVRLVSGMKEKLLPVNGEFCFVKRGGWTATNDSLFVHLLLKKQRLHAVAVSFLREPRSKQEAGEGRSAPA
jgi:hypothetical protein